MVSKKKTTASPEAELETEIRKRDEAREHLTTLFTEGVPLHQERLQKARKIVGARLSKSPKKQNIDE